ncbi:SigE family RNA polymerase sigma factor [Actinokineospora soli]|uniref:SigE family RNA polymerase sigma factor n=1 Tax=Actinokineospora soli TaxID=1048753 RepID=A0ABW2TYZ8_9PSEU
MRNRLVLGAAAVVIGGLAIAVPAVAMSGDGDPAPQPPATAPQPTVTPPAPSPTTQPPLPTPGDPTAPPPPTAAPTDVPPRPTATAPPQPTPYPTTAPPPPTAYPTTAPPRPRRPPRRRAHGVPHDPAAAAPDHLARALTWEEEFTRCFDRCAGSLRFTAFLLCGNHHEAEDVVQSAFLKLYLAGPRLGLTGDLDAYARQVVVRTFLAERRRVRWRRERLTGDLPDRPDAPVLSEDRLVLWSTLAKLPAKQRAVLVLRFWHDLGVAETAAALGCSEGAVKSHTSRGLAALRTRIAPVPAGGTP